MKKKLSLEVTFIGHGKVIRSKDGVYTGGVKSPRLGKRFQFSVHREYLDRDGNFNPRIGESTIEGAFQINITGNSKVYRELAQYFLGIAELDTSVDKGFHDHHENIISDDGRTRLNIIIRKK